MKTTQHSLLALLNLACCLPLASLSPAQQTNAAQPAEASAVSNSPPAAAGTESAVERKEGRHQAIVLLWQNAELKAGDTADQVVVIGGSAKIHGKVRHAAVVIGGNLDVDGEVGDAAVAVLGSVKIGQGASVHRNAVAVLGNLDIGQEARVGHDAVSVGGKLKVAETATVEGRRVNVVVGMPIGFPAFAWLGNWLRYCVLEFRPLAPQVGWIWVVAGVFFLLYLFIAAVFPRPVQACVDGLVSRPATTFLMGLLTKLVVPVVFLILGITGIGLVVVPFIGVALFLAAIVGKVAILEWIGLQLGRRLKTGFQSPLIAFLIGTIVITVLYMVPVLGLLTYAILSVWGLGCAVTALFGSMRRELPEKPAPTPPTSAPPSGFAPGSTAAAPQAPGFYSGLASISPADAPVQGASTAASQSTTHAPSPAIPSPAAPPPYPCVLSLPRAGFLERLAAAFLDIVIVGILCAIVVLPALGFLVALAYFVGMWTWKGTTIGGIVLKLQVVRADGGAMTFVVALVRGLAAALSVIVLFLGFLWIAWDKDKQGWHDKIAGTIVVRLPRSIPLVCV